MRHGASTLQRVNRNKRGRSSDNAIVACTDQIERGQGLAIRNAQAGLPKRSEGYSLLCRLQNVRFAPREETMLQKERRREQRFGVRKTATVKIQTDSSPELPATTENVSAHGILLHVDSPIPEGSKVEVILTIKITSTARVLYLVYNGKAARTEQQLMTGMFAVAVSCDHPASFRRDSASTSGTPL
jgi:hypothetical protein